MLKHELRDSKDMYNPRSRLHGLAFAMFLFVAAGCGGATRGAVAGKVTVDGRLVDGGTNTFIPLAAKQDKPAWRQFSHLGGPDDENCEHCTTNAEDRELFDDV